MEKPGKRCLALMLAMLVILSVWVAPVAMAATLQKGQRSSQVKKLQQRLRLLGYTQSTATGYYGDATLSAVRYFQLATGLTPTGKADEVTQSRLFAASAPKCASYTVLKMNANKTAVKKLEARLKQLGYFTGTPDKKYDAKTKAAVQRFEKKMGIPRASNGSASVYTQHYLFSSLAQPVNGSTGAPSAKPTVTAKPTATPRPTPTPAPTYKTLKKGSAGGSVKTLEKRLNALGYLDSKYVNTKYDSKTVTAVKSFQKQVGLKANGTACHKTQTALYAANAPRAPYKTLKKGSSGSAVKTLEKRLSALGYLSSKYVNTKYDSKTVTAVKNFQKRAGLTANGVADHKTQVALYAGSAPQPTVKPTPTPKPTATPRPTAKPTPAPTLDTVELPDDKVNKNTTLCYGSRNNQVILLSNRLRVLGYYDGSLTNRFDEVIEASVKWFQRVNKLTVDGVAGQRTLKRLYSPSAQRATGDPEPLKYRTKPVKVSGTPVKPKLNPVRNIDWFDNQTAAYFGKGGPLAVGAVYTVTDVETGVSFRMKRSGGTNHADVETVSAYDTWQMYCLYGKKWGWERRAVLITVDNLTVAASMNGYPHGSSTISKNNFDGHSCIHFLNSRTHGSNKVDPDHQKTIQKAAGADIVAVQKKVNAQ